MANNLPSSSMLYSILQADSYSRVSWSVMALCASRWRSSHAVYSLRDNTYNHDGNSTASHIHIIY